MWACHLAVSTLFFLSLKLSGGQAVNVQWRKPGESLKIHCSSTTESKHLYLQRVLNEDVTILQWNLDNVITIKTVLQHRIKTEQPGKIAPNDLLITISNLTADDAGVYRCEYENSEAVKTQGSGLALLVVHDAERKCDESFPMIIVAVLSIVILLLLCVLLSIWLIQKKKTWQVNSVSRSRLNTSDVYEDMRSTCRREGRLTARVVDMV